MRLVDCDYATVNIANYGPSFGRGKGGGHCIYVHDRSNIYNNSYALPADYGYKCDDYDTNNQETHTRFSGQTIGYGFRIL